MKITKHKTAEFIVEYEGRLLIFTHRPTDQQEGQRDSDQSWLYFQPTAEKLDFSLWIGDKVTILKAALHSAIVKKTEVEIIAKRAYYWDFSKPLGWANRASEIKKTSNWDELFQKLLTQHKTKQPA